MLLPDRPMPSRDISFKLKSPKSKALGQPSGVYVTKGGDNDDRSAYIYYGDPTDGINIAANKLPEEIDFRKWIRQAEKDKKDGILKADNIPFLIEVNGHEGYAGEPGYNIVNENKEQRPGFVSWQEDDGVVYSVYGTYGPNGTSVKELLELARTMTSE